MLLLLLKGQPLGYDPSVGGLAERSRAPSARQDAAPSAVVLRLLDDESMFRACALHRSGDNDRQSEFPLAVARDGPRLGRYESPFASDRPRLARYESPFARDGPRLGRYESPFASDRPRLARHESPLASDRPRLARYESPLASDRPRLARYESPFASDRPRLGHYESPFASDRPRLGRYESPFASDRPRLVRERARSSSNTHRRGETGRKGGEEGTDRIFHPFLLLTSSPRCALPLLLDDRSRSASRVQKKRSWASGRQRRLG